MHPSGLWFMKLRLYFWNSEEKGIVNGILTMKAHMKPTHEALGFGETFIWGSVHRASAR